MIFNERSNWLIMICYTNPLLAVPPLEPFSTSLKVELDLKFVPSAILSGQSQHLQTEPLSMSDLQRICQAQKDLTVMDKSDVQNEFFIAIK